MLVVFDCGTLLAPDDWAGMERGFSTVFGVVSPMELPEIRSGVVFTGEQYQRQTINGRLLVITSEVSAFVSQYIVNVFSLFMFAYKKCGSTPAFNVNLEVSLTSNSY